MTTPTIRLTSLATCAGCAAKAGLATLTELLGPIRDTFDPAMFPNLLLGLDSPDDAAVYRLTDELAIVQTVDFFPPVVDDPYTFGAIAAANAMSDVYAMGGEVLMALNIAAFPQDLDPALLASIFHGGAAKMAEGGGVIVGGHTVYDVEPKYGLAVTGTVHPGRVLAKAGAQAGDLLVLTKPLGTGLLLTAARDDRDPRDYAAAAIESMLTLNWDASHIAIECGAHAMTDVTGFGILGHAQEMAARSDKRFVIESARVPAFPGALECAAEGVATGGANRNREGLAGHVDMVSHLDSTIEALLYDPQTSGGLLVALTAADAGAMVSRLHGDSLPGAIVGRVEAGAGVRVE